MKKKNYNEKENLQRKRKSITKKKINNDKENLQQSIIAKRWIDVIDS